MEDLTGNIPKKEIARPCKRLWYAVFAAAVALAVLAAIFIPVLTNHYKTPLKQYLNYVNCKEDEAAVWEVAKMLNGCGEKEVRALLKIIETSEEKDYFQVNPFIRHLWIMEDTYGEDYRFTCKIIEKERIEPEDLREVERSYSDAANALEVTLEQTKDYTATQWNTMAQEWGITRTEAKQLVKTAKELYDIWKDVEVTAGYDMILALTVRSSELEEPEVEEMRFSVYKVNGRWVSDVAVTYIISLLSL